MSYDRPKWVRGHFDIGRKITVFGANAMHFMVTVRTKRYGVISFRPISFWSQHPLCLYASPNGTPWACTYCIGLGPHEKIRSLIRRLNFGHNFNSWDERTGKLLHKLNNKYDRTNKYYFLLQETTA
jgi:hypothetical protein